MRVTSRPIALAEDAGVAADEIAIHNRMRTPGALSLRENKGLFRKRLDLLGVELDGSGPCEEPP